ncbi:hypothetical protein FXN61_27185 [Lentzea sp. PSKA42]|uniref:Uncharacterized protein n=1 Tax=Lentzea indica TaxID=2604800 RepID=A0ABX1FMR6_9PSEU|nr:hypothetical protein [Lentzea indica]NKE60284.1 hypothetical protein [Lentzea indica]
MITGLVVLLRPAQRDAPATMPTAPATSLTEAATLLEVAEKPAAKYRHIRYLGWQTFAINDNGRTGVTAIEFEITVWLPTAPGEMVVIYRNFTGRRRAVSGFQPPPEEARPDSFRGPLLWGSFCAATPCKEDSLSLPLRTDPEQKLEDASSAMLSPFTTNEEKAALYRKLAESPEIRWDNGKVSAGGGRTQFTIDPVTGQVTGFEERKPSQENHMPEGMVTMTATITYEWTDQRPS